MFHRLSYQTSRISITFLLLIQVFTLASKTEQEEKSIFWSLLFLALGVAMFICYLLQVIVELIDTIPDLE